MKRGPTLVSPVAAMDTIFDTPEPGPVFATVAYDEPKDPPITIVNPDEPPPEFDPNFHPVDVKITPAQLRARANERVKNKKENQRYYNALIEEMGKEMETLTSALSISEDTRARDFLVALMSTKYKGWSITRIASLFGITPVMLTGIWRDYHLAQAMITVTGSLPKIAKRMVQDSEGGQQVCPHCDGRTTVKVEVQARPGEETLLEDEPRYKIIVCPNCRGEGIITKPGHEHSRDRILEMAGLTKKGGLNVTTIVNMPQVESIIDELDRAKAVPVTYSERQALLPGEV